MSAPTNSKKWPECALGANKITNDPLNVPALCVLQKFRHSAAPPIAEILHRAAWLPRDVMARRWADLSDSEASDQLDELIDADSDAGDDHDELIVVTVHVEDGGSVYVAMQPRDAVGDLSLWIEKT